MRKQHFIFILLLIILTPCFSLSQQLPEILPSNQVSSDSIKPSVNSADQAKARFVPKKVTSGVQFGTCFTSFSGNGSAFSTYISPYISYPVSSRFSISAGMTIVNSSLFGIQPLYTMNQENALSGNFTNALLFVSGDYLVNDRLKISGTLYKEFNLFNSVPGSNPYSNNNAQGGFMKVDYKVFENFHIEAGFGYSKGINPYNCYNGYPGSYGSPYSDNPFIH